MLAERYKWTMEQIGQLTPLQAQRMAMPTSGKLKFETIEEYEAWKAAR